MITKNESLKITIAFILPFIVAYMQLYSCKELPNAWLLFLPAIFASAWIGGYIGGIGSTFISTFLMWYLFIPPVHIISLTTFPSPLVILTLIGIMFSVLHKKIETAQNEAKNALIRVQTSDQKTIELAQRLQERELSTMLLENSVDAIHILDSQGRIVKASDSFTELLGYTKEEISRFDPGEWDTMLPKDQMLQGIQELIRHPRIFETRHRRKDGTLIDVEINAKGIELEGQNYIYASVRDITERKKTEIELIGHQTIFESITEGVYAVDTNDLCTYINQAALATLGLRQEEILGQNPHDIFHYHKLDAMGNSPSECPIRTAVLSGNPILTEYTFSRKDGTFFPVNVRVSPIIKNDKLIGSVVTFEDITESKKDRQLILDAKEHFDRLAHVDTLTGLPNRLSLIEKLDMKCSENTPFAFFILDLDGFKEINDSYGHFFGDKLLIYTAHLIIQIFPPETFIVRTGGDEFAVLLHCPHKNREYVLTLMKQLNLLLNQPINIDLIDLYITASTGIAIYPDDALTSQELLQKADAAMYNAKKMGRNTFSFYSAELTQKALLRTTMTTQLKKALQNNELLLFYQPQIVPQSGEIIGMEALLRWFSPEGAISPADFIPIAEETGLILEIGGLVLQEGCKSAVLLKEKGILQGHIAINVSARQLIHPSFLTVLENVLSETRCNPSWIELEITESSILENPEKTIALLHLIKSKGFHISIDDFGTGYSSLSYLKNLPIDKLKIDQSFIRNILEQPKNQTIIKTIIALSKGLGMQSLAEGVETQEELAFLCDSGIDSIQGYYYHKPMPIDEMVILLENIVVSDATCQLCNSLNRK